MNDSPAAILFDVNGNPVGIVSDGLVRRLRVESQVKQATEAVRTSIAASITDVLLVSANQSRISIIIYNNSDAPLYVGLGATPVTSMNYTYQISSQSDKELPLYFSGEVRGVWQVATGEALITETS